MTMVTEQIEPPSQLRFFILSLIAAVASFIVVVAASVNAWFLFPIAVSILAVLMFVDGYWQAGA